MAKLIFVNWYSVTKKIPNFALKFNLNISKQIKNIRKNHNNYMNNKILKIFIIAFTFFTASCSEYSKILKSPDADLRYEKALEYYKNEDYTKAMALFEDLIPVVRGTTRAEKVHYYYSYCNYNLNDYIMAGHYFRDFAETYPRSEFVEEMAYMGAYCYYLDSPITDLDQSNTYMAISELQMFVTTYPTSDKVPKCNELIDNL